MTSQWAFDWWPGGLAWLLVLELLALGVMLCARWIAGLIGKTEPTDFFVIFYRVFWQAMRNPRRYPVPINYEPVMPKRAMDPSVVCEDESLTEDELERLLAGGDDEAPARSGVAGVDDDDLSGGTQRSEMEVRVVGPSRQECVRGLEHGVLVIAVPFAPDDGRANGIAIGLVSRLLRVEQHQVAILAGHTKGDKTLRISGLTPTDLAARRGEMEAAATPTTPMEEEEDPFTNDPAVAFRDD